MSEQRWIPVRSHDELEPAMTVRLTSCGYCAGTHVFMLMRPLPKAHSSHTVRGVPRRGAPCSAGWRTTTICSRSTPGVVFCAAGSIAEGRLFCLDTGDLSRSADERMDDILAKHRRDQVDRAVVALNRIR